MVRRAGSQETLALSLRVSIGVATFPDCATSPADLVEEADRACYRAKAIGGGVALSAKQNAGRGLYTAQLRMPW